MTKASRIGEVQGLGDVYQSVGPLDAQIEAFQEVGILSPYLVDTQDVVQIRLAGLSDDFSRTSLAPLGVKGENTILYRPSPLMNLVMAKLVVRAHRNGQFLQLSRKFYEVAKEIAQSQESLEPEDRTAIVLSFRGDNKLTPEMSETRFALGKRAKEYFEAKGHQRIQFYDLEGTSKKETDVNYTGFASPLNDSSMDCGDRGLGFGSGAFGVRFGNSRSESQKISAYSLADIKNANSKAVAKFLKQKGVPGLMGLLEGLDNELLEELRNVKQ